MQRPATIEEAIRCIKTRRVETEKDYCLNSTSQNSQKSVNCTSTQQSTSHSKLFQEGMVIESHNQILRTLDSLAKMVESLVAKQNMLEEKIDKMKEVMSNEIEPMTPSLGQANTISTNKTFEKIYCELTSEGARIENKYGQSQRDCGSIGDQTYMISHPKATVDLIDDFDAELTTGCRISELSQSGTSHADPMTADAIEPQDSSSESVEINVSDYLARCRKRIRCDEVDCSPPKVSDSGHYTMGKGTRHNSKIKKREAIQLLEPLSGKDIFFNNNKEVTNYVNDVNHYSTILVNKQYCSKQQQEILVETQGDFLLFDET